MSSQISLIQAREDHYIRCFGSFSDPVMHSTDHAVPHIDIYQFPPSGDREWWLLVTGGMSDLSQTLPHGKRHRTELLMYVQEPTGWMFDALKGLAEYPFKHNTFFHWGHTIPEGRVMTAQTSLLTASLLMPPYFENPEVDNLTLEGDPVHFLWFIPITHAELAYAEQYGGLYPQVDGKPTLADLMEELEFDPVVDEGRKSIV